MLMILIPTYFWYCSGKNRPKFLSVGQIVGLMSWLILIGLVQFINYFLGLVYIINLVIGIVFCVLFAMVTQSCNALIDKAIKKSTILKLDAKKYVFYWLLLICLLETFIIIAYSAQ